MIPDNDFHPASLPDAGLVFVVATRFERDVIESGLRRLSNPLLRRWSAVVITGIGFKDRAALDRHANADCVISTGFAAGLRPELQSGNLLVPDRVVGVDGRELATSVSRHAAICDELNKEFDIRTQPLLQVGEVLPDPESKRSAGSNRSVDGADMESLSLAEYCGARNLPYAVLRAVLDPVDLPLPRSLLAATEDGATPGLVSLFWQLAMAPPEWPAFASLLRHTYRARRSLRRAVGPAVEAIARDLART